MSIPETSRRALILPLLLVCGGCGAGLGTLGTLGTLGSLAELVAGTHEPDRSPEQVRLSAEVLQLDTRRQMIQVETQDGRVGGVLFDLRTTITREAQPYPLNALQPGDVVELLLEEDDRNNLYARRIEVLRLAEDGMLASLSATGDRSRIDPATGDTVTADSIPADSVARAVSSVDSARAGSARPDTTRGDSVRAGSRPDSVPITTGAEAPAPSRVGDERAVRRLAGEVGMIDAAGGWFELHTASGDSIRVTLPPDASPEMNEELRLLREGEPVRVEVIVPRAEGSAVLRRVLHPRDDAAGPARDEPG